MNVGARIQRIRQELGLSRVELGRRIGVTGAAVGQWEKQKNGVRPRNVESIAQALEKPLDYFYRDAEVALPSNALLTEDDLIVSALDDAVRTTGVDVPPAQLVRLKMLALEYLKRPRG